MMRLLATCFLLLLLAVPAWAQDQELAPDGENNDATFVNSAGTACNAALCDDDVDELPASPDGAIVSTTTNADTIIFDFPTPSTSPSTGASAQRFVAVISRCTEATPGVEAAGGTNPNYDIAAYCGGTSHQVIASAVTVSSLDQLTNHDWTFGGACTGDGSNVQVHITATRAGGGANRRYPCIEALEWEVTHAVASSTQIIAW